MKTKNSRHLLQVLLTLGTALSAGILKADEKMNPVIAERIAGTSAYLADIGTIPFEQYELRFRIAWQNDTGTALTIRNVQPLCQCANLKASTDRVDRNETCFFIMTWELEDKYGAFGTGFMLETEQLRDPLFIQLAVRRPAPPRLIPEATTDFGVVQSGTVSERVVLVRAFDAESDTTLSATRAVTCDLPFVSGEVVELTNTPFRSPNTSIISRRHQLRVRLRCAPGSNTSTGAFSGTALVPIEYQGAAYEMMVPVAGRLRGSIYCRPDKIVLFARPGSTLTREFRVYSENGSRPRQLDVVCDESQVSQTTIRSTDSGNEMGCFAHVAFTIQASDSFRNEFRLNVSTSGQSTEIRVPIELFTVTNRQQ